MTPTDNILRTTTYVIFDVGNENYGEICGNLPVSVHLIETNRKLHTDSIIFRGCYMDLKCIKTICIRGKTYQDTKDRTTGCYCIR